jgi:ribosomal protein L7/L12
MDFRTALVGLSTYITNVPDLIAAADWVVRNSPEASMDYNTHEGRVTAALSTPSVMEWVRSDKKIHAIKELRAATGCGLKEAKEAVEDERVQMHNPWHK